MAGAARARRRPWILSTRQQHSGAQTPNDPETLLLQTDNVVLIERALERLPPRFRELLVLRELEGLTYRELADT